MRNFARVTVATLMVGAAWSGAAAQQTGPQPADLTTIQKAASAIPDVPPAEATGAADQNADSETVIVTGSRTPKAVDKIPGAVTIISPAEVQRQLAITDDSTAILGRTVPGYSESNQTMNTLGETMRGRTALYLFDGIPQSTPLRDGSRNATFTDMSTVQRIEVIGGASAAEGIGAAGGIINYISKRATEEGIHAGVAGRFGTQFRDDSEIYKVNGYVAYKEDKLDAYFNAAYVDRGITYDARGRRIGLSASSSLADTTQRNFFGKIGSDFDDHQRIEAVASFFRIASKGNYRYQAGSRALGIPDTAVPGPPLGTNGQSLAGTEFNQFLQLAVNYSNTDLFGGSLVATVYGARQRMRFPGDNGVDRQDPLIAPLGTLVDQSEINSTKYGLRPSYTRPDFLLKGLELRFGVDLVHDTTQQELALTRRVWVPPLKYDSVGPYVQLSYDMGPITVSGGWRHEDGKVHVDDYTTTYFRNRAFVKGGDLKYKNDLFNGGVIGRLGGGFSVFGSYSEGFTLPNVGIPLRNVNYPGQSVNGILDLQAVVFKNKEVGANWRGSWGSIGASYYDSESKLGSTLAIDPVTRDFVLVRRPVRIRGIDFTSEFKPTDTIRLNLLYSHVKGETTAAAGVLSPYSVTLGTVNISPDKLNGIAEWRFTPEGSVSFGATSILSRSINQGTALAEKTNGYTLFDATASYKIKGVGTVTLAAENLFNRYYFLASSQVDIFQNYFAGRGRTVSLSLRADF
jgi:iron complex outermembrane receptor protein